MAQGDGIGGGIKADLVRARQEADAGLAGLAQHGAREREDRSDGRPGSAAAGMTDTGIRVLAPGESCRLVVTLQPEFT